MRETAFVRLEAIAAADNHYSLLQVFGHDHIITKRRAVAYVTWCNPGEVVPKMSSNCTEEIPVMWNDTGPISYVMKSAALPTFYNNIAPPRWNIVEHWYCACPAIWECGTSRDLPVEAIQIDD